MLTVVAILMFAGAMVAALGSIYATIVPAMPKVRAALSGAGVASQLPPLPPRRSPAMRVTAIRPVAFPARALRAAA